jgi:hypothetical protein
MSDWERYRALREMRRRQSLGGGVGHAPPAVGSTPKVDVLSWSNDQASGRQSSAGPVRPANPETLRARGRLISSAFADFDRVNPDLARKAPAIITLDRAQYTSAPAPGRPARPHLADLARALRSPRALALYRQLLRRHPADLAVQLLVELLSAQLGDERQGAAAPEPGAAGDPLPYPIPEGWTEGGECPSWDGSGISHAFANAGPSDPSTSANHGYADGCLGNQGGSSAWPISDIEAQLKTTDRVLVYCIGSFSVTGSLRLALRKSWWRAAGGPTTFRWNEPASDPVVRVLPNPSPYRDPHPKPGASPKGVPTPGESLTGKGYSPSPYRKPPPPAPSGHRFKPPGPGKREKKLTIRNLGAWSRLLKMFEQVTEFCDKAEAFFEALPKCRLRAIYREYGRQPRCHEKAFLSWKHFDEVNPLLAIWNLAVNEAEDFLIGKSSGILGKGTEDLFGKGMPIGNQTRFGGRMSGLYGDPFAEDAADTGQLGSANAAALVEEFLTWVASELLGEPVTLADVEKQLRKADSECK